MKAHDRKYIEQIVIDAINSSANSGNHEVTLNGTIDLYMKDSIEFVKVLISIEDKLSFEFMPEELKLDNIITISELVNMICVKINV